jgi:type II secretory pathway pseudopilin PulG
MWITMIFRNWQLVVIGLLSLALMLSTLRGNLYKAELSAAKTEMQARQDAAQAYQDQSERNAKVINDAIPVMVKQAEANAWKNWQAKFGSNVSCGVRAEWLRAKDGVGEAESTERTDGLPEQEFVVACASDAGITEQWKAWARLEGLEVTH